MGRWFGVSILAFWLLMTAWLVRRDVLPAIQQSETPSYSTTFGRRLEPDESLMGIYLGAQKIGTSHTRMAPRSDATYLIENTTLFQHVLLTGQTLMEIHSTTSVDSSYALKTFEMEVRSPLTGEMRLQGVARSGELHLTLSTGGEAPRLLVAPMPEGGTLSNGMSPFLSMPDLAVGKSWRIAYVNPLSAGQISSLTARVERREPIEWEGREQDAFVVVVDSGRQAYRAWILPDGKVIREEIPFGPKLAITLRREPLSGKPEAPAPPGVPGKGKPR